jgi:succinate dehydrogenase/fumarate reductase cytochrome b subunit
MTTSKLQRTTGGKICKFVFILFNILMLWWMVAGMGAATEGYEAMSEAEQSGTAIGTGVAFFILLCIWALGDIILGMFVLFTRPRGD